MMDCEDLELKICGCQKDLNEIKTALSFLNRHVDRLSRTYLACLLEDGEMYTPDTRIILRSRALQRQHELQTKLRKWTKEYRTKQSDTTESIVRTKKKKTHQYPIQDPEPEIPTVFYIPEEHPTTIYSSVEEIHKELQDFINDNGRQSEYSDHFCSNPLYKLDPTFLEEIKVQDVIRFPSLENDYTGMSLASDTDEYSRFTQLRYAFFRTYMKETTIGSDPLLDWDDVITDL